MYIEIPGGLTISINTDSSSSPSSANLTLKSGDGLGNLGNPQTAVDWLKIVEIAISILKALVESGLLSEDGLWDAADSLSDKARNLRSASYHLMKESEKS